MHTRHGWLPGGEFTALIVRGAFVESARPEKTRLAGRGRRRTGAGGRHIHRETAARTPPLFVDRPAVVFPQRHPAGGHVARAAPLIGWRALFDGVNIHGGAAAPGAVSPAAVLTHLYCCRCGRL